MNVFGFWDSLTEMKCLRKPNRKWSSCHFWIELSENLNSRRVNLAKYERILVKLDRVSAQPQLTQCGAMLNNLCVSRFLWWLHKFLISPLVVVFVILFFAIFWRNIYHPTSTYIDLNELISVLFCLTNTERRKKLKV